jgi:hypothetical protein
MAFPRAVRVVIEQGFVTTRPPSQIGDVIIRLTRDSRTSFDVGVVSRRGQADFRPSDDVAQLTTIVLAVQAAKALARPQGRIYLIDIDTHDWSELPS